MCQQTEVPLKETLITDDEGFIICNYCLRVFDKNKQKKIDGFHEVHKQKTILNRYITSEELARKLFEKQVKVYHNKDFTRVIIYLYDLEKCTNIEYYDSDDNI